MNKPQIVVNHRCLLNAESPVDKPVVNGDVRGESRPARDDVRQAMNISEVLPALGQCYQEAEDGLNKVVLPALVREVPIGLLCDGATAIVSRVSLGAAR